MLTLSTCLGSPASSFPGLRKAGRGARNEAAQVSRVIKTRMFLRGLDEVCQLLYEVNF